MRKLLFVLCETNFHGEREAGGELQVYRQEKSGQLSFCNRWNTMGAFPTGIVLTDRNLVILNHGSNLSRTCVTRRDENGKLFTEWVSDEASLCVFERTQYGMPGELRDQYIFHGCRGISPFQDSPAPHDLYYAKDSGRLYVPMRGTDETKIFLFDQGTGQLALQQTLHSRDGCGPRNAAVFGNSCFILSEIDPLLTVFYETSRGYERLQEISVIPEEKIAKHGRLTFNYPHPSGIAVDEKKRKLYTITRTENVLTVFDIRKDGTLERRAVCPFEGKNPRQIVLCGKYIHIVCMDTREVLTAILDETGIPLEFIRAVEGIPGIAVLEIMKGDG